MDENLLRISDGKIYGLNDMVRVGCHDCDGCSACCEDMGQSVILNPYDVWLLTQNLGKRFEQLMQLELELHVEEGLLLPNLRMVMKEGRDKEECFFLNEQGRCSVHSFRPGICRLFPLGRNYEETRLDYFLLVDACPAKNKTKVKVEKWLGVPQIKKHQKFLVDWHNLTKRMRQLVVEELEEKMAQQLSMAFLQMFYLKPYESEEFYEEFYGRLERFEVVLNS